MTVCLSAGGRHGRRRLSLGSSGGRGRRCQAPGDRFLLRATTHAAARCPTSSHVGVKLFFARWFPQRQRRRRRRQQPCCKVWSNNTLKSGRSHTVQSGWWQVHKHVRCKNSRLIQVISGSWVETLQLLPPAKPLSHTHTHTHTQTHTVAEPLPGETFPYMRGGGGGCTCCGFSCCLFFPRPPSWAGEKARGDTDWEPGNSERSGGRGGAADGAAASRPPVIPWMWWPTATILWAEPSRPQPGERQGSPGHTTKGAVVVFTPFTLQMKI